MALNARIVNSSLIAGTAAIAAIFVAGCGSTSSGADGQATSQAPATNSAAASAGTSSSAAASPAASSASGTSGGSTPAASASGGAGGAKSCLTSNLRITLGDGGAGAGTDFTVIDFTNTGTAPCTLLGYPGASLTNSSGAQIGAAATRNPSKPATVVTLAPGAKASATLGVANAENYPASTCKPTAAAGLKVFPPNQTQPVQLSFSTTGCAVTSTHQLSVTAVAAGAGQTVGG
jgi:hypothetical protein